MQLFSIIIPCYNKSNYIRQTVESLINQTYQNWECIIVDDNSNDNSREIINSLSIHDSRIKVVFKEKNSGVADCRNIGLCKAKGEYVIFLDADDLFHPDKLSATLDVFTQKEEADVVYSNYNFVKQDVPNNKISSKFRIKLHKNVYLDLLKHWDEDLIVPIHCCCYRRSLLIKNNIRFDFSLKNKEDWDFLLEVAKFTNAFYYLNRKLVSYLIVPQSRSSVYNSSLQQGVDQLFCKHYNEFDKLICKAIAYNLRYRLMRNRLIRLLGKREPTENLYLYSVAQYPNIKQFSLLMIPKAILKSICKLLKICII